MKGVSTPLHPSQQDVYVDQLLHTGSPHYNIGGYIKLRGALNFDKFKEAVNSSALVFDAFKMRFDLESEDFSCLADEPYTSLELGEMDFSTLINPEKEAEIWMQDRFNTTFIIEPGNRLFEHSLIKISEDEHWFFGRYHHLITDGYGFIVFVNYVGHKYSSLLAGDNQEFVYPPYIEEATKASYYFDSKEYADDAAYWNEKISVKPLKVLQKRTNTGKSPDRPSATHVIQIDKAQREFIEKLQEESKSGLQQLTIATLLIYFGKTTGNSDFIFGIPVHKRSSRRARSMVGMFSGILPFKGKFDKNITLRELLDEIGKDQRSDYRHQSYPIGDLSRDLKINSSEGYLHEVSINYELFNFELDFGGDLSAEIYRLANEYDRNPLQLSWRDYGSTKSFELHAHYLKEYFNLQELTLLINRLLFILEQFSIKLDKPIGSIEILPPKEKELLQEFNNTKVDYPVGKTIISLFEEQAAKTPAAIAIVFEEEQLTYNDVNQRANQLAHYLIEKGVKKDTLVPVCIERSADLIIGIIGILKSGGAYVPIDPEYPENRISYMLNDSGAKMVISSKTSKDKLVSADIDIIEMDSDWVEISKRSTGNPPTLVASDNLAYVIYTSGSTGQPKGVMIEHRNVYSFIKWCCDEFSPESFDIVYASTSVCFDLSVFEIFFPLSTGKRLRLIENGLHMGNYLSADKKVMTNSVPGVIQSLLLLGGSYLDNISVINMAGEPIPLQVIKGLDLQNKEVRNLYGPTEDTTYSTVYRINNYGPALIGKPIANSTITILNTSNELMPVGVVGEICIGGAGLARGYLNNEELSRKKFIRNPFNTSEKLYKTGDLGRWLTNGNIDYLGRIDDQVKIRGYRIELGEIETHLQKSELVQQAVVLARQDMDGNRRLVGYVVPKGEFDRETIINYLSEKLPEYMVPGIWIEMESLPLTPNGKIDKKALPDSEISDLVSNAYEAPVSELEVRLVAMWEKLLKIDKVGINDNFFELGGHSMNALQLISRLHKLLNIKPEIGIIFTHPTIKKLAQALILEKQSQFDPIQRLEESDHYKLSHSQKRFWILSFFKEGIEVNNMSNAFTILGDLKTEAFKKAFESVIDRHEILRTVFVEIGGEPWQKVLSREESGFTIEEIDLQHLDNSDEFVKNWIKEDTSRPFDLVKGPLLRAALIRRSEKTYTFVFNIHHIISDGWSKGIFIKEILNFYKKYSRGEPSNPNPIPIQYRDFAAWHNNTFQEKQLYWNEVFKNEVPVLNFPLDFKRPKVLTFKGAMIYKLVPESLTRNLHKMAVNHYMSLNNLVISLYGLIVSAYSKQEEVVIGSLSSGRSHFDLENLIGVFINFLPIRLTPKRHIKMTQYLANCQKTLLNSYSNQDYPFDLMVERIKKRDISRNPFFDTMLNFHLENNLQNIVNQSENQLLDNQIKVIPDQSSKEDLFRSVLDFKLDIEPAGKSLDLYLSYNTLLLSRERMEAFLDHFVELMTLVADEKDNDLESYLSRLDELIVQQSEVDINQAHEIAELPVVICASFVAEPIGDYIDYWSKEFELNTKVSFTPYNQVFQQLLDPESILSQNRGINFLFIRFEDWLRDHKEMPVNEQLEYLDQNYRELLVATENFSKRASTPLIIGVVPVAAKSGSAKEIVSHIVHLNRELEIQIKNLVSVYTVDLDKISALYDIEEIFDLKSDEMGHMPFTPEFYAALGTYVTRKIKAFKGPVYKVIALDCDNTLWKGICGELGALEVTIDENFIQLQEFMLEKYREGFLLVLCSKNNEEDVWEVFEKHPAMVLKREHISAYRINWEPKPDNLLSISKELNLGINSFIFIDDNEFETEQMTHSYPDVLALTLPEDEGNFSGFLNHIWEFDRFKITEEDVNRNQLYRVESHRKEEQVKYATLNDFLQSLKIEVTIRPLGEKDLDRSVQLSMRTNQFNLNGVVRSLDELRGSMEEANSLNWLIEVKDRFGDYGIVGLVLGREIDNNQVIDTFLLSCRVLGRNVEDTILSEMQNHCGLRGLNSIVCMFKSTPKNKPFEEFINRTEWVVDPQNGSYVCSLKITDQINTN